MSYPLAFPAGLPAEVEVARRHAQRVSISPTSLVSQVRDEGGRAWRIVVRMQPLAADDAAVLGAFIHGLQGMVGTFTLDLTPWCPGVDPAPGVVTFRLNRPDTPWDSEYAQVFGFTFEAEEDVA